MANVKGNRWIKIEGEKELIRKFGKLGQKLQKNVLVRAVRPGAKRILDRARDLAPRDTGTLATRGLQIKVTARRKTYGEVSVTNTNQGRTAERYAHGAHAILQEFGVDPHMVGKRKHPGHKAQPFMRPAFDEQVAAAEADISENLRRAVVDAAR